jgi:negative regulator of sigma-B (phosphoserine phosphatase)
MNSVLVVDTHMITTSLTGPSCECGDIGLIKESDGETFLALVDVLGHGKAAHDVAVLAKEYLEVNHRENLTKLMEGLHECLKGTRGAVAAFCRLDLITGELRYTGMGNITVRVLGPSDSKFIPRDGILGYTISTPKEETQKLSAGDVLLMYSDGIREHLNASECSQLLFGDAKAIATDLIGQFSKGTDDASSIVLRYLK